MLTAAAFKAARPKDRPYKMHDGNGLFVIIRPNGSKWWRFRYKLFGKTKELSMGIFPEVTIREARFRRDEARQMLAKGIDPATVRQVAIQQSGNEETFEFLATEWHKRFLSKWTPGHAARLWRMLEKDAIPFIGALPVKDITPMDILNIVRRVEERGALESAHRLL